jgi:UDP-2,3-diacylglucosamine hydrolase
VADRREPIAVIAGAGRLPELVAAGVIRSGSPLVVLGIGGFAGARLAGLADDFVRVGLLRVGGWIRAMRRRDVRRAVLVGSVRKGDMHASRRVFRRLPDLRTVRLWYRTLRGDRRDNAVLLALAEELQREGIELMDSTAFCSEHLAGVGVMTRTQPNKNARADAEFGFRIAQASAELDIGQSLAVRDLDILAVEAVEGTDAMIERAGALCPAGGWTLVKVARPNQDMRFDVPTVGPATLKHLADAGGRCLVLEAGRTLILDKLDTLKLADRLGIAVMGLGFV